VISLTPYQAQKLLNSIIYRRRLCQEICELEAQLISYIQSTQTRYLAGYEIFVSDHHLSFRKLKPLEWKQLKLKLEGGNDG